LNEEIRRIILAGGGIILLGVYLATKKFSSRPLNPRLLQTGPASGKGSSL
jgi:hypothetical protein